ncbi:uncharacterized protein LOC143143985 [Ptiloglossa arizonensis]|uniref:uncharacterized protein LOC143143985 n=1 Tax=Ptiloglossa arizonensis TaxID=3350558 RepID=UPI003F9FEE81
MFSWVLDTMRLTGWRYVAFVGCFVGLVGIQSYFVIISPMINPEPYKRIREQLTTKH